MKKLFLIPAILLFVSCSGSKQSPHQYIPSSGIAQFRSSDTAVVNSYDWARDMALSYAHDSLDPVGFWYEAALPQREAFCMRDVSHQSIGAEVLGLKKHNQNMFTKFAENISESRDWCSYWEINRHNEPAPVDYENDQAFWYNLNANFDVMFACQRLFNWTGDSMYIKDPAFVNFFDKSVNQYIAKWALEPDQIMTREVFMNAPQPMDMNNRFHTCRGLPSYVESFYDVTASADLVSTIYAGLTARSEMAALHGNDIEKQLYAQKAQVYRDLLENEWWCDSANTYYTFRRAGKQELYHEVGPFLLWFNATENRDRVAATLAAIGAKDWNIENRSHFPVIYYKYNQNDEAYKHLNMLKQLPRAEYPEVSYGVVEGVVTGYMGIQPDASEMKIATCAKFQNESDWAEIRDLSLLGGYVNVRHLSKTETELTNNTPHVLTWKAMFQNPQPYCIVDSHKEAVQYEYDVLGNKLAYIEIQINPGETKQVLSSL